MKNTLLILVACVLFAGCTATKKGQEPLKVIFDTDVGNDIDDVLALQMLFTYEQQQKVKLLGVTISKSYPRVIEYVDAYCRLNGRPDMPLGYAYNGVNPEPHKYVPVTLDTVIDGSKILHPRRTIADSLPEGYKLQRKLLAAEPDGSVVLIVVGPETNIARLLESGGDEFSPLTGIELVKRKVKFVSAMGGLYTNEFDFPEWNIVQDLPASKKVFALCPVPIIASGFEVGDKLRYPAKSILNDFKDGFKHPMIVSYKVYDNMPYDRQTWDLTSVLYAVEPDSAYFDLSPLGKINIDSTGKTTLAEGQGQHRYLKFSNNRDKVMQRLVALVTGKEG